MFWGRTWVRLAAFHQFDLAWTPFFREDWLERAVEAREDEISLVEHSLDPVAALHSFRPAWTEVNVVEPSATASAAGDGYLWLPARGWPCGVSSIERVWLT
jgi:hypothetical protein